MLGPLFKSDTSHLLKTQGWSGGRLDWPHHHLPLKSADLRDICCSSLLHSMRKWSCYWVKSSTMTFADELSLRATLATCGTRAGFAEPGRQTMMPMLSQSIPQTVNHHFSLLISACKPQNIQKISSKTNQFMKFMNSALNISEISAVNPKLAPSTHLLAVEVYLGVVLSGLKIQHRLSHWLGSKNGRLWSFPTHIGGSWGRHRSEPISQLHVQGPNHIKEPGAKRSCHIVFNSLLYNWFK